MIDNVLLIVEADAIDNDPPEIVSGKFESRLLIESDTFAEWTTLTATSIVTSSAAAGHGVRVPVRGGVPVAVAAVSRPVNRGE